MKRLFACLAIALLLAACGNKGPLVMPDPAPTTVPAPAAPVEAPVPPAPASTQSGTPTR